MMSMQTEDVCSRAKRSAHWPLVLPIVVRLEKFAVGSYATLVTRESAAAAARGLTVQSQLGSTMGIAVPQSDVFWFGRHCC